MKIPKVEPFTPEQLDQLDEQIAAMYAAVDKAARDIGAAMREAIRRIDATKP